MIGEGICRIVALACVVLAAAALTACGDSSPKAGDSAPSTEASSAASTGSGDESGSKGSRDGESKSTRDGESAGSAAPLDPEPLQVSGGGSAQFRTKGGDNSIQEFGEESDEGELEEAAGALHDYLVASAEEDWPAACSYLGKNVGEQLDALASRSDRLAGKDCAEILRTMMPSLPVEVRRESTIVDAGSLRLEDERAFLIYRGAEETEYVMLMEQEDGEWLVGSLTATPIS